MVALNFDATQVAPDTGFDALPAGWYNVAIDHSESKPTKDADAQNPWYYVELRFNILDGQYQGRKFFSRLNLRNKSQEAMEIAYKQLSAICHAVGVMSVQDTSQLHGLPMKVKVNIRKDATGQYDDQNDIKQYKPINHVVETVGAGVTAPMGGPTAPQAPAGFAPQPAAPAPTAPTGFAPPPAATAPPPPAAQLVAPPAPVDPRQGYQISADGKYRWKEGMVNWELIPEVAPPPPPPPAAAAPTQPGLPGFGAPAAPPTQGGWTPPAAAQPWANGPATPPNAAPAQPAAPPAQPQPPHPAQQAQPPWNRT